MAPIACIPDSEFEIEYTVSEECEAKTQTVSLSKERYMEGVTLDIWITLLL